MVIATLNNVLYLAMDCLWCPTLWTYNGQYVLNGEQWLMENTIESFNFKVLKNIFFVPLLIVVLYLSRLHGYLVYHTLMELFCIVIAFIIFAITWNTRQFMENKYLFVIGISYFFVGGLDTLHILSYKGMNLIHGLTTFKRVSEYVISFILVGAMYALYKSKRFFDKDIFNLIAISIFFTILSELCFTIYEDLYDYLNVSVHILKVISYYFIYKAVVVVGLNKPVNLLFRNIGKEKENLKHLNAKNKWLLDALDNVHAYVYIKDKELRYVYANRLTLNLFNCTQEELTGCTDFKFFESGTVEKFLVNDKRVIENGEIIESEEITIPDSFGKRVDYWSVKHPLYDANGKIWGLCGISTDITERNKLFNESKLKSEIVTNMAEGVVLINTSDGSIVYCNPKFEQMFAYSTGELIGKNISIINAPAEKPPEETAKEIQEYLKKYNYWVGEVNNVKKNGETFWTYATVSTFNHQEYGDVWISIHTDITEHKKSEQEIFSVKQRLELAKQSANLGIWDWNITNNIMTWDDQMLKLYGLTWETFPGGVEAWQNGLHPDDRDIIVEQCNAALRGDKEWDTEFRVLHPNGTLKYIKANGMVIRNSEGTPIRMLGINYDITERKIKEKQERYRSYTMLSTFIDNIPDMAWIKDVNGQFVIVNKAFGMAVNMPINEIIGKTDLDVWPREFADRYVFNDMIIMVGRMRNCIEETYVDAEGQMHQVEVIRTPYTDENGVIMGTVGIAHDITEHKRLEEALHTEIDARRMAEQRLGLLLDATFEGVSIAENGRIIDFNKRLAEMYG
ncbi:MAG: PAS domain S-box protein, partial [Nitrospirae bacterium]|nr:PAS domain S-box protein [Nitrospirota bacterium]